MIPHKLSLMRKIIDRGCRLKVELLRSSTGAELGYLAEIEHGTSKRWTFAGSLLGTLTLLEQNTRDLEAPPRAATVA